MKISVIIPIYNSEKYLYNCLNSIARQTYEDLEIICIDDGSSDSSKSIITDFASRDPRFVCLFQQNSGVSAARNAGLRIAKGDVLTFVDSDDEIEPDMYEMLIGLMIKYNADITHCGYKRIWVDGSSYDVGNSGKIIDQSGLEAAEYLLNGKYFTGGSCNKLFKRELFIDVWYDTSLIVNEDILVVATLFSKAARVVFCDEPKYYYYDRFNSATSSVNQLKRASDMEAVSQRIFDIYKETNVEKSAAKALFNTKILLYRAILNESKADKSKLKHLKDELKTINNQYDNIPFRKQMDLVLIVLFPQLYSFVYSKYDKVRKPHWDL